MKILIEVEVLDMAQASDIAKGLNDPEVKALVTVAGVLLPLYAATRDDVLQRVKRCVDRLNSFQRDRKPIRGAGGPS